MPRRPIITILAALGLALACSPAAFGSSTLIPDSDEPNVPDDRDIEWAAVDHPPSVSGRWVRHTVKFRAPYSRLPCFALRTDRTYKLYGGVIYGGGPATPVQVTQTPPGAPDTVSYSFDVNRIGNPSSYMWSARNCEGTLLGDRAPDNAIWEVHWLGPPLVAPLGP
jgi:hypothetical protein